jgi:tRNA-specific 2-thiouridylase
MDKIVRKKVVVGMSGGVDSSVAALLLKERGYEVVGIHLNIGISHIAYRRSYDKQRATSDELIRGMASKLNIPFCSLDLEREFKEEVINYFIKEYSKGHTPNPCVVCNRKIKFKALLKKAKELKADYIATGHYAKVVYNEKRKRYLLKKGRDRKKDQSYVLCALNQKQLKHTLFPLANFTKEEVRRKARELGIHDKPSSQEICFVPDADYRRFLETRSNTNKEHESTQIREGLIVDREGKVLGKHKGIAFYTIGQRRWLGLALGKPLYVIAIDSDKDVIVVGNEQEILRDELIARDVNWIAIDGLKRSRRVKVKIRYQHREAEAAVTPLSKNKVKVKFEKPQRAITPGQAVVFYDKDIVLGGGWIC